MAEPQLARPATRRLAILQHAQEATGNVARFCRQYGISRQRLYMWQRRDEAEALDGLSDRSGQTAIHKEFRALALASGTTDHGPLSRFLDENFRVLCM